MSVEDKKVIIANHIYQPKHEILSHVEAEESKKRYNTKPSQLPYILVDDKDLEGIDVRPGDIIRITRKSLRRVKVYITICRRREDS